jgi:plasmid stability protein
LGTCRARLRPFAFTAINARMATLTIRQLDDTVKERLRVRAAQAGRSMEEEAREIIGNAVAKKPMSGRELFALSRELFGGGKGIDLDLPKRSLHDRPAPDFSAKRPRTRRK